MGPFVQAASRRSQFVARLTLAGISRRRMVIRQETVVQRLEPMAWRKRGQGLHPIRQSCEESWSLSLEAVVTPLNPLDSTSFADARGVPG